MINCKKIFVLFLTLSASLQAEFMIFDQGHTVISGPVRDTMITHCDIYEKRNLDGSLLSLDERINREIIQQTVIAEKMPIDDTAPDKYIANIQKTHNLSAEDLDDLAEQCNLTIPELKQLLGAQYTYDFFLYHKFRSHLVPTDQQVEEYCKEHPEIEAGYCSIQVAFVEYTDDNKKEVSAKIDDVLSDASQNASVISWSDPIRVDTDNIADDKLFIKEMAIGKISVIDEKSSDGKSAFELYKLVERVEERAVSIESRKAFVIDVLNRQMYEDLLTNYEIHMRDNVAIINLSPTVAA